MQPDHAPRVTAVHFGPGRLGLGLIVETLLETKAYDVYLLGPPGSGAEQRNFFIRFTDPAIGLRERHVHWAGNPRGGGDLPSELIERLRSQEPVLFSSALGFKDGVGEAAGRIASLLELRPEGAPTIFLICENDLHPMYEHLKEQFPRVEFRHCVVDRICELDGEGRALPGRRVLVHDVAEIVVPGGRHPALAGLLSVPYVQVVTGDAEDLRDRKKWVVNGIHMTLATYARRKGVDLLPLTGEREEAFSTPGLKLGSAMLEAAEVKHRLAAEPGYASERIRSFREMPDSATRILNRRYLRADLTGYAVRIDDRLAAPARVAANSSLDLGPFVWAFRQIILAIQTPQSFLDVMIVNTETGRLERASKPPAIDRDCDHRSLEIFEAALDWAPAADRERMMRRLRRALANWY